MEADHKFRWSEQLRHAFVSSVEDEFAFLIEIGYKASDVKLVHSDLVGDRLSIDLISLDNDRECYISVACEETGKTRKFVNILIDRINKSASNNVNDRIEFGVFCERNNIELMSLNEMKYLNEEAIKTLRDILIEYTEVLKLHFLLILRGEEWVDGMYTAWR